MSYKKSKEELQYLEQYQIEDYKRPSVAVDIALFAIIESASKNYRKIPKKFFSLLLIKRAEYPFKGMWALPGGFLREQETLEEAAARELKEETGISEVNLRTYRMFSETNRDPRGWIISNAYLALTNETDILLHSSNDAEKAAWFQVEFKEITREQIKKENSFIAIVTYQLVLKNKEESLEAVIEETIEYKAQCRKTSFCMKESKKIAFDHSKIIAELLCFLREQVEHTNIAFDLLPKEFTLSDLQKAYELILDKDLLTANFRRKISDYVIETEHMSEGAGHRPAKLYKRNLVNFYNFAGKTQKL